jgi:hypothetical protein
MPLENWQGFLDLRRKMRAELTPRAITLTINKLAKLRNLGQSPAEVLDQTVMNGWKGVFELKGKNGNGKLSTAEIVERECAIARARAH